MVDVGLLELLGAQHVREVPAIIVAVLAGGRMPGDALHALERHLKSKDVIVYVSALPQVAAGDALPEPQGRVHSQKPCRAQHELVGLLCERHAVPVPHCND